MAEHRHDLRPFRHSHAFADSQAGARQRALVQVTLLTLVVMVVELAAGWWSGSLALLADGWHMGTHALALGGAALAYQLSARAADREGYAFGGWKIEVLAAYTSGLVLLVAAGWIAFDAVERLRAPQPIAYAEAMVVACLGLAVNLASAWLLARSGHGHGHDHADHHDHPAHGSHDHGSHDHGSHAHGDHAHHGHHHGHGHDHGHQHDHNFRAAYVHVIADAFTSVLAIVALAGGLWFGWGWLDPVVALVGAAVIAHWALGVLKGSAKALVDATADETLCGRVRDLLESDHDAKVADLHVWQVGARAWSAAVAVVADRPLPVADYRQRLAAIDTLRHVTIEVHRCPDSPHPQGDTR